MSEELPPEFIPWKDRLWNRLLALCKWDTELADAHEQRMDHDLIEPLIERVLGDLEGLVPPVWDIHFMRAIICEFCDPERMAIPDADRYEDLLKQWDEGLFDPEPV